MLSILTSQEIDSNFLLVTHNSFMKYLLGFIALGTHFKPEVFFNLYDRFTTKNTGIVVLEYKQYNYEQTPSWYIESWMI